MKISRLDAQNYMTEYLSHGVSNVKDLAPWAASLIIDLLKENKNTKQYLIKALINKALDEENQTLEIE